MNLGDTAAGLAAEQMKDSEHVENAALAYASNEAALLDSVAQLADAAGVDCPSREWEVDARAAWLVDLYAAVVSGDFAEFWSEQVAGHEWDRAPPAEWVGAGTDSDVWQEQIQTWAAQVRDTHPDIEATDRELANIACREAMGADLAEVEGRCLSLDRGAELRRLVGGNIETVRRVMQSATAEIRDSEGET